MHYTEHFEATDVILKGFLFKEKVEIASNFKIRLLCDMREWVLMITTLQQSPAAEIV